jgi:hypothetical protein
LKLEGPESKMTIIELPAELFYKGKIWWTWSTRWLTGLGDGSW